MLRFAIKKIVILDLLGVLDMCPLTLLTVKPIWSIDDLENTKQHIKKYNGGSKRL